jgi:hypothetical protein
MPRLKFEKAPVVFHTGGNVFHCTKCYKNYEGWRRAMRHHKRTGHDGFTRHFTIRIKVASP